MKQKLLITILSLVAITACIYMPNAVAGGKHKYRYIAEFKAEGKPKRMELSRKAGWCMIRVTEGTVIIDSVVVVEGDKKTMVPVTNKLVKGDKKTINIGPSRQITALIINDREGGTYKVYLKQ
jgi:hypothetical protein